MTPASQWRHQLRSTDQKLDRKMCRLEEGGGNAASQKFKKCQKAFRHVQFLRTQSLPSPRRDDASCCTDRSFIMLTVNGSRAALCHSAGAALFSPPLSHISPDSSHIFPADVPLICTLLPCQGVGGGAMRRHTHTHTLLVFDLHVRHCHVHWRLSAFRRRAVTRRRRACNLPIKHQAVAERLAADMRVSGAGDV